MDFSSEGLVRGGHSVHLWEGSKSGLARNQRLVTIDMLPDDVLVEIFYRMVNPTWHGKNTWHALVHVCRRWRYLVFASPRRLNLRLVYGGHRPMSEILDAWPVLPLSLISGTGQLDQRWDNMVAALESEHYNRICEIYIRMTNSLWERFTAAMQKPFPELTHLRVSRVLVDDMVPVLPESFLRGSAPPLRSLFLGNIPFPSIPKLLLSAHGLVTLTLWDIPDSGYFSPGAIATALAVMTRLEFLHVRFPSPRSRPDRSQPPPTRFVLPALTELMFKGIYEYLEDLLAQINAPRLYGLYVEFFMDLNFHVPQLHRFIGHAEEFKAFDCADVAICDHLIKLRLYPSTAEVNDLARLVLRINGRELDHKLSSLTQVCSSSFRLISALKELEIWEGDNLRLSHRNDDMENARWLELLDSFTALKNLYLSGGIAPRVCGALQELSRERATEVLPALRNLLLRGSSLDPVQEVMKSFVTARRLSGHPVVVAHLKD